MNDGRDLSLLRKDVQSALNRKDWPEGVRLLEEWCRLRPEDGKSWYYRAYFTMKMGRASEARVLVDKALKIAPQLADARKLLEYIEVQGKADRQRMARQHEDVWQPGRVVDGRYEVKGFKKGGMGAVYFAFDRQLDRMVAIKAPLPALLETPDQRNRLYREAEAWIKLGIHPNICSAYYVHEIGGTPWLFIEYVAGGTLGQWLKSREVTLEERLDIAIQIASGMSHTHDLKWIDEAGDERLGLVHRDLKPANILMEENGVARITDFGLVGLGQDKSRSDQSHRINRNGMQGQDTVDFEIGSDVHWQTLTATGAAIGTPPYMAPEQWESSHEAGKPTDIYAFGCILYDLFCGRRPFVLERKYQSAMPVHQLYMWEKMHREATPPDPRELSEGFNDKLAGLMLRCLEKIPSQRPAGFGEIKTTLKTIYANVTDTPYARPEPRASRLVSDSLNNQGVSYITIDQADRAVEAWHKALNTDPHHIEANYNISLYQWKNGGISYDEIFRRMEEVGQTHQASWRHKQLMGRLYLAFGEYSRSVALLQQAAKMNVDRINILRDLGLALSAESGFSDDPVQWSEVDRCFQSVMEMGYEDPVVITGRALALSRQGRDEEAAAFYRQAAGERQDLPDSLEESIHRYMPGQEIIDTTQHIGPVKHLTFDADGCQAICASVNKISTWTVRSIHTGADRPAAPGAGGPDPGLARTSAFDLGASVLDIHADRILNEKYFYGAQILACSFSPRGRYALTGSPDHRLRLWDVHTADTIRVMEGHTAPITAVAYSPGGRYGLSGSEDASVRLWDLKTGKLLRSMTGHRNKIVSLAFSPDGKTVLSAGEGSLIHVWDLKSGQSLQVLEGHQDTVTVVGFSPNGRLAYSVSADKTLRLWDVHSLTCLKVFQGHEEPIHCAGFSPDGRYALTGSSDKTLRVWDTRTQRLEKVFKMNNRVEALAVSPDARLIVTALANPASPDTKTLYLLEFWSKERYRTPYAVTIPLSASMADVRERDFINRITEARNELAAGNHQQTFMSLTQARTIPGYERDTLALELWNELSRRFPCKKLRGAWEVLSARAQVEEVNAFVLANKGQIALLGCRDGRLRIWSLKSKKPVGVLEGHTNEITALDVYGQGRFVLTGGKDHCLRWWDLETEQCLRVNTEDHQGEITAVVANPDGRFALTADDKNHLFLWDLRSFSRIRSLTGHSRYVTALALTPDGAYAVSAGMDMTLRQWDLATGECCRVFRDNSRPMVAVTVSPDGLWVMGAQEDGTIRRWELNSEVMPIPFNGHSRAVRTLTVSSDGNFALSGSEDQTLRLWDMKTAKCQRTFEGHTGALTTVSFSPDRMYALSTGRDQTFRLWRLDWQPDVRKPALMDEAVKPFLNTFLLRQTPYKTGSLAKSGKPKWNDEDLAAFQQELIDRGFGWIQTEGVAAELKRMARRRRNIKEHLTSFMAWWSALDLKAFLRSTLKRIFHILYRLIPAVAWAFILEKNDYFGLPIWASVLTVFFMALIMVDRKK